jgi:hypothetical protein
MYIPRSTVNMYMEGVALVKYDSERVIKMSTSIKTESGKVIKEGQQGGAETLEGKQVILAILGRAADESDFLARLSDDPGEALAEYYTLTSEERAALASGDIKRIEGWVGKLDKRLATWLWCRLSQEKF